MPHATEPPQLVELPQPVCRTGNRQPQCPQGRDPLRCKAVAGPVRNFGRGLVPRDGVRRAPAARARRRTMLTRMLPLLLCVTSISCADEPPPAPPPDTHAQEAAARLNAASMAVKKEERKLYLLKRDLEPQEQAAAYHVFSTTLPPELTIKGLRTVYLDPRKGGDSINFEEPDDRTDAEQDNLQKVRDFANKFAADCRQPDSPTAKKIAAEINAASGSRKSCTSNKSSWKNSAASVTRRRLRCRRRSLARRLQTEPRACQTLGCSASPRHPTLRAFDSISRDVRPLRRPGISGSAQSGRLAMLDETLSRRDFHKAGAASLAGAVSVAASGASLRAAAASNQKRLAFIGVGNRGGQLLGAFLDHPDAKVVALCDIYQPYWQRAQKQVGGKVETYDDFRRVLDRKDIDAVVIATPDHWHAAR